MALQQGASPLYGTYTLLSLCTGLHLKTRWNPIAAVWSQAMVTVQTEKYGVFDCKPLQFIWSKFEEYDEDNTVMLDDLRSDTAHCWPPSGLMHICSVQLSFHAVESASLHWMQPVACSSSSSSSADWVYICSHLIAHPALGDCC